LPGKEINVYTLTQGTDIREALLHMTIQVIMPQMGESIFEGTLTKWLKNVGEAVIQDEPLFEVSMDKVDSEIPSPATGILSEILIPEGKTVQINTVLAIIQETDAAGADAYEVKADEGDREEKKPSIHPQDRGDMSLHEDKPLNKPESAGTFDGIQQQASSAIENSKSLENLPFIEIREIRASPLVRRLARENNVDLSAIRGSGLQGRITKEDLFQYLEERSGVEVSQKTTAAKYGQEAEFAGNGSKLYPAAGTPETQSPEKPQFAGEEEIVPMSPMRKAIAEHMILSKRTSAHVNTVFEVDMSAVVHLRERYKMEFQNREGFPLTYTPFFAKALVDNVRESPLFNSSMSGENIVYKKSVHLGIAVALDSGLIVPVVKNAHLKSFTGLAIAIHDLAERARTKRLKPDDVQNGTISMTNPGSFGALFNTPIISQPQVAILGVGGIEKRPVVINDAIAIRSMVCLSLTFDHRVIDGAVADRFMAKLKERLQNWRQWMD
jgi:pyruvate dehydrogenase E2 component (dihydrolipoamide acetyltransferase)